MPSPIYVARPDLPPLEEFLPYLQQIWDSKTLTNGGPFHQQLEAALCEYLGVKHLSLCSNGTLGLIVALQALGVSGEVITTPYSFVATAHSLMWNGIAPVFVDIDPLTLNLDPSKIEAAITERTSAILAVHCYGHPCDVDAIQTVADRHGLKVIYDAAHAFGVRDARGSVLNYGDLSVLSFHATKVFHTFEGGAIVCPDAETKQHVDHLKNFGFVNETTVIEAGINGKLSEINAALGLLQLGRVNNAILKRREIDAMYRDALHSVLGIRCMPVQKRIEANFAYFPVLVGPEYPLTRNDLYETLRDSGIFSRRYFYPLIANFPMYREMESAQLKKLPVANAIANQVLCLPMYSELSVEDVERVINVIRDV